MTDVSHLPKPGYNYQQPSGSGSSSGSISSGYSGSAGNGGGGYNAGKIAIEIKSMRMKKSSIFRGITIYFRQ